MYTVFFSFFVAFHKLNSYLCSSNSMITWPKNQSHTKTSQLYIHVFYVAIYHLLARQWSVIKSHTHTQ